MTGLLYFMQALFNKKSALLIILYFVFTPNIQAQILRVTGKVVDVNNEPLMGVYVSNLERHRTLAVTDEGGKFAVDIYADGTLEFSMLGYIKTAVKINNRTQILVKMEEESRELGQVTVSTQRITDKIVPDPTDIEVKGNYFHVKTRIRIPREMYASNTRLVVQPVMNNITQNTQTLMRPLVLDGNEYNKTQRRMYDYDIKNDPLAPYIVMRQDSTHNKKLNNDIIYYHDSVYIENIKNDFNCDVYMAIEDYNRILYRDTAVIARGTVNPLRFLDIPITGRDISEEKYYPKAEMQLREDKGEINLHFQIGVSKLDLSDTHNQAEVGKLQEQLKAVANSEDASIRKFSITGTASPDGRYETNLKLANNRMRSSLNYIIGQLDTETRKHMNVSSEAHVASWQLVADLLKKDNKTEEAAQVQSIIDRFSRPDDQSLRMRRLPFYHSLLVEQYLPRLRKVEYELTYSIYRFLTIEEIEQMYTKDYHRLSRYEFFHLYRAEKDSLRRERLCRQALETYPHFMVAANDLQACLIKRGASDPDLLTMFAGKEAPVTVNTNHMIALLHAGRFESADSINAFVPENEQTSIVKAITSVLNGKFEENAQAIAATSTRNEVLVLLAMKYNEEALALSERLDKNNAVNTYIQAICLNRVNRSEEAYEKLKKAIEMQPSLKKIAQIDGDVNALLTESEDE